VTEQQRYSQHRPINPSVTRSLPLWHTYVGITGLLLVIVIALAGGIIWYNSNQKYLKFSDQAIWLSLSVG
jgi:hypothetical protein